MTAGPGHNGGPTLQPGASWRRHCWGAARAALLPHLPVEVVRLRVRRARELGLDYQTYAGVRATTGHDIVAFLFSSNALRLIRPGDALPDDRRGKLAGITGCGRIALAQGRLAPDTVLRITAPLIDAAHPAPAALAPWAETRRTLRAALGQLPGDRVLLVADTALEAEWATAARLAAALPAARYFG
jgi:hypothetical protein